jgi:hypothetical protein
MVAWLLRSLLKMRLNATRLGSIASSRSFGDQLDDLAGQVPSLDLNFAQNKSLIDDYSGTTPVTHTRASSGTYVDSDGVLRSAVTNLFTHSESISSGWGISNTSITSDAIASPVGTITADLATNTGGNDSISRVATVGSSATVAFSLYMKRSNIDWVRLTFLNGANEVQAWFNLSTGTIGTVNATGTATSASASIQNIGNGWYRCVLVGAIPGQTSYTFFNTTAAADASFTRVTGGERYLWGAQLEQSATVGEYIPTTSTINSAPRFDHDPTTGESLGLLGEEARTNLCLQSEDFSTSWTTVTATVTTNVATAPNGTTTADLYSGTSTSAVNQSVSLTSGITYTISFYVKSAGLGNDSFRLRIDGAQTSSNFTATSEWQRFTFTATSANTGARTCGIVRNTAGDNVDVLIWGAQLEVGAFPTSYIPTTSATATRAADVASITGSNFGVTRTNLLVRSEEFDNAAWTKGSISITANTIVAPDGTLTGDKLVETTSTSTHQVFQQLTTTAQAYTATYHVKAGERNYCQIRFQEGGSFLARAEFNLATGQAIAVTGTPSITSVGNGWYRISLTATSAGSATFQTQLWIFQNSTTAAYTGDGTSGLYIWGAQLEVGSAVTPYIQSPSVFTSRASSGTYVGGNGLIQTATTNEARYDHDPISLIGKGLLLEEARTNLLLTSEAINVATAPDGTTTADKLITNNGVASVSSYITQTVAKSAAATTYTYSVFAKTGDTGTGTVQLLAVDTASSANRATSIFSTVSGTIVNAASVNGTFTNASSIITPLADGWYRLQPCFLRPTATDIFCGCIHCQTLASAGGRLANSASASSGLLSLGRPTRSRSFCHQLHPNHNRNSHASCGHQH